MINDETFRASLVKFNILIRSEEFLIRYKIRKVNVAQLMSGFFLRFAHEDRHAEKHFLAKLNAFRTQINQISNNW